jgi:hypothetical protein
MLPITVMAQTEAWKVFVRSNPGNVSSMDSVEIYACFHCAFVLLCVDIDLAMGWSPVQAALPTIYKIQIPELFDSE